jgi:hypothetical protein
MNPDYNKNHISLTSVSTIIERINNLPCWATTLLFLSLVVIFTLLYIYISNIRSNRNRGDSDTFISGSGNDDGADDGIIAYILRETLPSSSDIILVIEITPTTLCKSTTLTLTRKGYNIIHVPSSHVDDNHLFANEYTGLIILEAEAEAETSASASAYNNIYNWLKPGGDLVIIGTKKDKNDILAVGFIVKSSYVYRNKNASTLIDIYYKPSLKP